VSAPADGELDGVVDTPLESLPHVDEHGLLVLAQSGEVWKALVPVIGGAFSRGPAARAARALGCAQTESSGPPDVIGSTMPGFMVVRVIEPAALALQGSHRFARYGLIFSLEPTRDERTLLRAETRADFPGLKGSAYRALVVGTRVHVAVVNRILRAVKRRAERGA
jgi:hypothetical protein